MAEVIGLVSGLLTLAAFAHQSVIKVQEAVQSFQRLPRQLRELLSELAELSTVLQDLSQAPDGNIKVDLSALKITLEQCHRSCDEFAQKLKAYSSPSSQDQLIRYKSTIIIALSFANLHTSTITIKGIQSYRELIKTTTINLEAHLTDMKEKLDALACRTTASPKPDRATIKYIENERINTEKGLQLYLQLSQHIDQIQLQHAVREEHTPSLLDPHPTSKRLVSEGLGGCKDYITFTLERLKRHQQKVSKQIGVGSSGAIPADDKLLLDNLNDKAEALRHSLDLFSNIDNYLEEKISNIKNHAEGDDTIQFMVSTDGKPLNGKNHGIGSRLKQAGGHFKEQSLQQISQDFTTISLHQTGGKKPARDASPPAAQPDTTTESLGTPFNGRGFTLTPKPEVRSTPSSRFTQPD
ncbi:pathogenicity protein [Fusarium sp. NRRL 25303]|nr:pathogenicity protein [Fusarium sp. NRRL 25303]